MYQFETENLLIFKRIPITGTVLSCQTGHAYHQHRHSGTTDVCFRFRQSLQLLLKVLEKFKIQTVFWLRNNKEDVVEREYRAFTLYLEIWSSF